MDRESYEQDLKRRQEEHLNNVQRLGVGNVTPGLFSYPAWRPCMHDACRECVGTGIRFDGSSCVHNLSCDCPKCSPTYCAIDSTIPITTQIPFQINQPFNE